MTTTFLAVWAMPSSLWLVPILNMWITLPYSTGTYANTLPSDIFHFTPIVPKVHTHMPALSFAFAGGKCVSIVTLLKRNEKI
jgi:hypothetical protein